MSINERRTPSGEIESKFRLAVRNALDADIFSRDDQIVAEIDRLKRVEADFIAASEEVAEWKLARAAERSRTTSR